jgi:hypothetical protein
MSVLTFRVVESTSGNLVEEIDWTSLAFLAKNPQENCHINIECPTLGSLAS